MSLDFLKNWFDLSYWFNSYPGPLAGVFLSFVWWFVILALVASLGLWGWRRFGRGDKLTEQIIGRVFSFTLTMAILVGVTLFFSQTETPVLGSRFWFLLWLVVGAIWLARLLVYLLRTVPKQKKQRASRQAQTKYLS
ncbi:MAG: hypothetical protein HY973_02320 [Candidatus Kerfeldbacteria bacterium]|nr:hypothetical protein [Candidatus Kerfeldbacteria bacterium]